MEYEDTFTFHQKDLPSESFSVLREMRRRKQLCDVTINVKGRSFFVHRIILAAVIPFFRVMFTSDTIESKARKLDLKIVDANTLESLIEFAYSGRINITGENARALFFGSAFLKMRQVQDACSAFLEKRLNCHNVLDVRSLADSLNCKDLVRKCDHYIRSSFDEFSQSATFLCLTFQYLKELVARDDLQVTNEEKVYEAVMKWVKSSIKERGALLPELLKNVRLSNLAPDYLVRSVSKDELIRKCVSCQNLVEEANNCQSLPNRQSLPSTFNTRPRLYKKPVKEPVTMHDYDGSIYCVCWSDPFGCIVQHYDDEKTQWTTAVTNDQCPSVTSVVATDTHIHVFSNQSAEALSLKTLEWHTHAPCPTTSTGKNIVYHFRNIYCFDGSPAKTVWCLNRFQNEWLTSGHMLVPRSRAGIVSLAEYIYLFGGLHKESDCFSIHDSVERYDPQTKQVVSLSPMLNKRWGHGFVADNGKIYACGGHCGNGFLSSKAEVYDCLTDQWVLIHSMAYPRYPFSLVPHCGKLYAIGGRTQSGRTLTVEIYDPETNKWEFGEPVPSKVESEEIRGAVIISKSKTVAVGETSTRKPSKSRINRTIAHRRNSSRQSFSKA